MFWCTLLCVHSSFAIILVEKREMFAFLSSWCLVVVVQLFFIVPRLCLQCVIVIFPDHTHLLFLIRVQDYAVFTRLKMRIQRTEGYQGHYRTQCKHFLGKIQSLYSSFLFTEYQVQVFYSGKNKFMPILAVCNAII